MQHFAQVSRLHLASALSRCREEDGPLAQCAASDEGLLGLPVRRLDVDDAGYHVLLQVRKAAEASDDVAQRDWCNAVCCLDHPECLSEPSCSLYTSRSRCVANTRCASVWVDHSAQGQARPEACQAGPGDCLLGEHK